MLRPVKILIYFIMGVVFIFVMIEMAFCYYYRNLSEINMTYIEREPVSMKLAVRKAQRMEYPAMNISFYAKEGPFWFSVSKDFTDLQICSCRNTSVMVVYSCYDISSGAEKTKLLDLLKLKYLQNMGTAE